MATWGAHIRIAEAILNQDSSILMVQLKDN